MTVLDPSVSQDVDQFWIQGNTIIGPSIYGNDAGFYQIWLAVSPRRHLGLREPYGAVISE